MLFAELCIADCESFLGTNGFSLPAPMVVSQTLANGPSVRRVVRLGPRPRESWRTSHIMEGSRPELSYVNFVQARF